MGWSLGVIKVKCLLWGGEYSPWFHHWNLWLCPTEEAILLPVFTSLLHCLHFSSLTRMETKLRSDKWGLWELPRSICIKLVRSIATISLNHLSCSHWPPGRTQYIETLGRNKLWSCSMCFSRWPRPSLYKISPTFLTRRPSTRKWLWPKIQTTSRQSVLSGLAFYVCISL